jgi:GT2 family glycosyltransferase
VESVLEQLTPEVEYGIVDGASSDGTREYLDSLKTAGVRWVSEPDRGIADAMNKGVRLASGAWVAHLHAGDRYLPGALDAVLARARATSADVLCGAILKDEDGTETRYGPAPERLRLDMTIHHPAVFTRREVFQEIGGFDERYPNAMDYDFFLRAFALGKRFETMPETIARMASGGQSERSLWRTYRETQRIRRTVLASGWERSDGYLFFLVMRGAIRRGLQRVGLGGLVSWVRRRFALAPKD